MNAFYVGQRVRIIGALNSPQLIGRETFIVALNVTAPGGRPGEFYEYVGHKTGETSSSGLRFVARPEWLQPLIPPGLESLEEINALYEPEPMRVSESEAFALELYVAGLCHEGCK